MRRNAIDDRREQSRQLLEKHLAGQATVARQIARVGAQGNGNLLRLNGFISTVANPGTDDLTVARVFQAGDKFLEGVGFDMRVVWSQARAHRLRSKKRSKSVSYRRGTCHPNLGNLALTQCGIDCFVEKAHRNTRSLALTVCICPNTSPSAEFPISFAMLLMLEGAGYYRG
jgi:hypothetical protein